MSALRDAGDHTPRLVSLCQDGLQVREKERKQMHA